MPKVTFYPLGNADSILIDLRNGKKMLFDFGDQKDHDDPTDKRIDLSKSLRTNLEEADRDNFDIVAFTHLDRDHVNRAASFFWFDHAKKYQGEDRARIDELWVPAAVVCEEKPDFEDADVIQAEARYRLKEGYGIRVFSGPSRLDAWFAKVGIKPADRQHLITNAGEVIPGLSTGVDGVEFFAHCPFAHRTADGTALDRNDDSLVVQGTFEEGDRETKLILGSDLTWEMWVEIVKLTKKYKNESRLEWDLFKLPHHCSYLSLGPEKGKDKTKPVAEVAWLFETQGREHGIVVSTSDPIPTEDTDMPPHRQAANYHRGTASDRVGDFLVTMEHPSTAKPEPLAITIDRFGMTIDKKEKSGVSIAVGAPAPRAG